MGKIFSIIAFLIVTSLTQASIPENMPQSIYDQIIQQVIHDKGYLDMSAVQEGIAQWQLQQPLPATDGILVETGNCTTCSADTQGTSAQFKKPRNVRVRARRHANGKYPSVLKIRWKKPLKLKPSIRSQYKVSHYLIYISKDGQSYEVLKKKARYFKSGKLKRLQRIKFKDRTTGTYAVQVQAVYKLKTVVAKSAQKSINKGASAGYISPWSPSNSFETQNKYTTVGQYTGAIHSCLNNNGFADATLLTAVDPSIDCTGYNLQNADIDLMANLVNIRSIILKDNPAITDISVLENLNYLEYLDLSNNPNIILPDFSLFSELTTLKLANMGLTTVPDLSTNDLLTALDLNDNAITSGYDLLPNKLDVLDTKGTSTNPCDTISSDKIIDSLTFSGTNITSIDSCGNVLGLRYLTVSDAPNFEVSAISSKVSVSIDSFAGFCGLTFNNTNIEKLEGSRPINRLNLLNNAALQQVNTIKPAVNGDTIIYPDLIPASIRIQGSDSMDCSVMYQKKTLIETLPFLEMKGVQVTTNINGNIKNSLMCPLTKPADYRIFPTQCKPDPLASIDIYEDINTQRRYITWAQNPDYDYTLWGVTYFKIQGLSHINGDVIYERNIALGTKSSLVQNSFEPNVYTIRACTPHQCGDAITKSAPFSQGLSRVTDLTINWLNLQTNIKDYKFSFNYPNNLPIGLSWDLTNVEATSNSLLSTTGFGYPSAKSHQIISSEGAIEFEVVTPAKVGLHNKLSTPDINYIDYAFLFSSSDNKVRIVVGSAAQIIPGLVWSSDDTFGIRVESSNIVFYKKLLNNIEQVLLTEPRVGSYGFKMNALFGSSGKSVKNISMTTNNIADIPNPYKGAPTYFEIHSDFADTNGETLIETIPASHGNQLTGWESTTFNYNPNLYGNSFKVYACNPTVGCGVLYPISISDPVISSDLSTPNWDNVSIVTRGVGLRWNVSDIVSIDYFEFKEASPILNADQYFNGTYNGSPGEFTKGFYLDINDVEEISSLHYKTNLERLARGHYKYKVRSCKRDRVNGDVCSLFSDSWGDSNNAIINRRSLIQNRCADHPQTCNSGQEVALPTNPRINTYSLNGVQKHRLLWEFNNPTYEVDYFYIANTTPATNECTVAGVLPLNEFTVSYSDKITSDTWSSEVDCDDVGSASTWAIKACLHGIGCSTPVSVDLSTSAQLNTSVVPTMVRNTSGAIGGPGDFDSGLWGNPGVDGTGWMFFWASELRYPSTHENYKNTYDLIGYWYAYIEKNGVWTPTWFEARMKQSLTSTNPAEGFFEGELLFHEKNGETIVKKNVGHVKLNLQEHDNNRATLIISPNFTTGIGGGGLFAADSSAGDLGPYTASGGNFSIDIQNLVIGNLDSNGVNDYGLGNNADHHSGLWQHYNASGYADMNIMSWIEKGFEFTTFATFDDNDLPIWLIASNLCHDNHPGCTRPTGNNFESFYSGSNVSDTRHELTLQAVLKGFNPLNAQPLNHDFGSTFGGYVNFYGKVGRDLSEGIGTRLNREGNFWLTSTDDLIYNDLNDTEFYRRSFPNFGTINSHVDMTKTASLHDIRFFINGNDENVTTCDPNDPDGPGECVVKFTWYTDDFFPSIEPFYKRGTDPYLPLSGLCGITTTSPDIFVVTDYQCTITIPGTYTFQLRKANYISPFNKDVVIAESQEMTVEDCNLSSCISDIVLLDAPNPASHSLVQDSTSSKVGFTSGALNISMDGSASYSVPIFAPAGTGGMKPSLSLVYNSNDSSNNLLGVGWNIGGISSISRCLKNKEQDGIAIQNYTPITLTNTDAFCLDGQKLKLLSGDNGENNAQYKTEIESFSKITIFETQGNGPETFKVFLKNGEIREYGKSAGHNAQILADNTTTPITWLLNKISDRNGNEIWFNWNNNNSEKLLETVEYTRRGTNPDFQNQIVFSYEDRDDDNLSYSLNGTLSQLKRLKSITTQRKELTNSTGFTIIRQLNLDYQYSALSHNSQIHSITSCADSSSANCLEPVVFDWSSQLSDIGFSNKLTSQGILDFSEYMGTTKTIDINGDGRKEIIFPRLHNNGNGTNPEIRFFTVGNSNYIDLQDNGASCGSGGGYFNKSCNQSIQPTEAEDHEMTSNDYYIYDFNGDGNEDMLSPVLDSGGNNSQWTISYSNGKQLCKTTSSGPGCINQFNTGIAWEESAVGGAFSDFTGDGLPDLLRFNTYSFSYNSTLYSYTPMEGSGKIHASYFNSTKSSVDLVDVTGAIDVSIDISGLPFDANDIYCSDNNGVPGYPYSLCSDIVENVGGQNPVELPEIYEISSITPLANDFNGDGLTDVLISYRFLYESLACLGGTRSTNSTNGNDPLLDSDCWVKFWAVHTYEPTGSGTAQLKYLKTIGVSIGNGMLSQGFLSNDNGATVYSYANPDLDFGNDENIQVMDFNGDGLSDVVTETGILINNGQGFNDIVTFDRESDGDYNFTGSYTYTEKANDFKYLTQFIDYDYDGDLDILYAEPESSDDYVRYRYRTLEYDATTGYFFSSKEDTTIIARNKDAEAATVIHLFDDFNGDSYPDHLYVKRVPGDEKHTEFSNGAWKARDKIVKITKTSPVGLKDETKINYESSTLSTVYARTFDGFAQDWGNGSAVFDISAPNMYLVRQVSTLSPIKTSSTNESSIYYHYKGLKVQGGGRGSLGFSEMSTVDIQNNISTQTTYRQDFPFTGSPETTMKNHHPGLNPVLGNDFSCTIGVANCSYSQCSGSNCRDPLVTGTITNPLSDAVNEYELVSPASNANTHFVFLKKSIEDFYELDKPDVIKTIVTEMNYADKANPSSFFGDISTNSTKVCSSYTNGVCSVVTSSEISNQYNNSTGNINNWILGRLSSSTSTQSRLNEVTASPAYLTITNTSSFTYDPNTGQILTEISGTGTDQYMQTKHIYDIYGNESDTLLCSQSIVNANNCTTSYLPNVKQANQLDIYRHSKNIYDPEWYLYVNQTQSLFGAVGTQATMQTTNQVLSRDIFGNITKAKDLLNNITGESVYGLFGELQASKTDTGTYSQSINKWCTSTTCPDNAALVTITSGAGMPTSKEYKDAQGRVVRVQGQSRAGISNRGAWTTTDSWYDASGRAKQTTVPYFMSVTPTIYLSTNTYDDLGRVIATSSPNHAGTATTSTIYDGLKVTHLNAKNQKKVSYMDETGKTIQIDQFLNDPNVVYSSILYYYGANDKLIQMNSNGAVTTMEYDNLGRKTSMVDPDKGNWSYTYLPTGGMQTQTDGLGQIISFTYDVQGRLIEKVGSLLVNTDQETNNKWYYDENSNYGKLSREISITHSPTAQENWTEKVIKHYSYDNFGRPSQVITQLWDGDNGNNLVQYTQKSTYDQYSRAFQNIDATGYGTMMVYDEYGFQYMTMEAAYCDDQLSPSCQTYNDSNNINAKFRVYYEAVNIDQFGNVIKDQFHNSSLTTIRNYNDKDGVMESTCIDSSPDEACTNSILQDKLVLGFDKLGNLTSKQSTAGAETFTYDTLNRLKTESRTLNGNSTSASYDYTENGNLTKKAGEILTYDATQPHAVSSFKGTNFSYDANGNMTASTLGDFRRTIAYSGLSKAYKIKNDNTNKTNYFIYDTNHSRIVRKDSDANMRTKLTHYIGNVEMIKSASNGNIKTFKRYIGALIIDMPSQNAVQGNWEFNYQFKDHIGTSLSIITLNASGLETQDENMSFDAWGQRRFVNNFTIADINLGDVQFSGLINKTTKGFTGHEHLDETGIIHMNGRIYTAYTGRFLQADPLIQDPFDTQSLNRYTYVSNNPLSLSDPTGYFSVDAFMQSWGNSLISIGLAQVPVFGPYLAAAFNGLQTKAATGSNRKALIGAYVTLWTTAAFGEIGAYYDAIGPLSASQIATKIALHGAVGGISALAQGGNFGHGFASAGVTQGLSPLIKRLGHTKTSRVFIAAIVGGTASRVSGGKFANGAVTGAFSRLFNDESDHKEKYVTSLMTELEKVMTDIYKENGEREIDRGALFITKRALSNGVVISDTPNGDALASYKDGIITVYPSFFEDTSGANHINDTFLSKEEVAFLNKLSLKQLHIYTLRHEIAHGSPYNRRLGRECGVGCITGETPWEDRKYEKHAERKAIDFAKKYIKRF